MKKDDAEPYKASKVQQAPTGSGTNTVPPDADGYPDYALTVKTVGFGEGNDVIVHGPHTAEFMAQEPIFGLKVEVTHNPTVPPVPNLTITITKQDAPVAQQGLRDPRS